MTAWDLDIDLADNDVGSKCNTISADTRHFGELHTSLQMRSLYKSTWIVHQLKISLYKLYIQNKQDHKLNKTKASVHMISATQKCRNIAHTQIIHIHYWLKVCGRPPCPAFDVSDTLVDRIFPQNKDIITTFLFQCDCTWCVRSVNEVKALQWHAKSPDPSPTR